MTPELFIQGRFDLAASLSMVRDVEPFEKHGAVSNISAGGQSIVWDGGSAASPEYPWDAHLSTDGLGKIELSSDDVGDASVEVRVYGLNYATNEPQSEIITLDAVDPTSNQAESVLAYSMVHRMEVYSADKNVGEITARFKDTTTPIDVAIIKPAESRTQMAVYEVPAGYRLSLDSWSFGISQKLASGEGKGELYISLPKTGGGRSAFAVRSVVGVAINGTSYVEKTFSAKISLPAGARIEVRGYSYDGAQNFVADFEGYLISSLTL